jgi:hypothetical protein
MRKANERKIEEGEKAAAINKNPVIEISFPLCVLVGRGS